MLKTTSSSWECVVNTKSSQNVMLGQRLWKSHCKEAFNTHTDSYWFIRRGCSEQMPQGLSNHLRASLWHRRPDLRQRVFPASRGLLTKRGLDVMKLFFPSMLRINKLECLSLGSFFNLRVWSWTCLKGFRFYTWGVCLTHRYWTRLEKLVRDKHSSLYYLFVSNKKCSEHWPIVIFFFVTDNPDI